MDVLTLGCLLSMKDLRRVFADCRRYPGFAVATFLCAIFSTAFAILYPKLTGSIINDALAGERSDRLLWMVLAVLLSFFLRDFLNALRIVLNNTFEQNVIFDLRSDLYSHLQRLPLRWFDNQSTGDLLTRVSEDVTSMERVLIDGIEQGSVAVLQILGVGIWLFSINSRLAWLVMLPMPLLATGALIYTKASHQRHRAIRRATSAMNALLLDNLQGVLQIKSFGREKSEHAHFKQKARAVLDASVHLMKTWAGYSPSMSFLSATGIVLVLYFGGLDVLQGRPGFRVGDLMAFLLYVRMFHEPVEKLHQLNQLFQGGRAAAERVFKILDTAVEEEPGTPLSLPPREVTARRVEFQSVEFEYEDGRTVLHEISLVAQAGQTIALVGPTGAGKSSLVGLIPRFYRQQSGNILIDNINHNKLPLEELRRQVGVVTQEAFLFNASVRENLLLGKPSANEEEIYAALHAANAFDFVVKLPRVLETNVGEHGVKLSVGEKQRLSIARALLKDPPILILDEATASVDTATERLIQEALERLLKNRTSFVIAHRLSTVRRADLICVLQAGRIIERGRHDELLNLNGLYAKLCHAQSVGETIEQTFEHLSR